MDEPSLQDDEEQLCPWIEHTTDLSLLIAIGRRSSVTQQLFIKTPMLLDLAESRPTLLPFIPSFGSRILQGFSTNGLEGKRLEK